MDTWDDKNTGEKRSKIRVHADRVQFLDSRRGDSGGGMGGGPDDEYAAGPQTARDHRRGVAEQPAPHAVMPARATPRGPTNGPGRPGLSAGERSRKHPRGNAADDARKTISRSEM